MIELPAGVAIVLDLDDTLYSERSFHDSGFRWIAERTGLDPDGPEVEAAQLALRSNGRPLDVLSEATDVGVATLLEWHRAHPPTISLYPDAARLLDRAQSVSIPLVLLTDGRSVTQRNKIEALRIGERFRAVLISEESGVEKSSVDAFRLAAKHLPDVTRIVYVGDNLVKDIRAPSSLGWLVLLMRERGDNVHAQLQIPPGTQQIHSLDEVHMPARPATTDDSV